MGQESVRTRILAAAEEQLIKMGYSAMTMDHLADVLGMSKRTLYEHFRSKDSVFEAIIERKNAEIAVILQSIIESKENFVIKVTSMLPQVQQCLGAILTPHILSDVKRNAPELWKTMKKARDENIRAMWTEILTEGKKKGYVRKSINIDMVVFMWIAVLEKAIEEYVITGIHSLTELRSWIVDIFLQGVVTEKGRPLAASFFSKEQYQ